MDTATNIEATKTADGQPLSHADLVRSAVEHGFAEPAESVNPSAADHVAATDTPQPDAPTTASPASEAITSRTDGQTSTSAEANPAAPTTPAKPEPAKKSEREAKSEDRAARTWQEINAEKARLAEERRQLEQARAMRAHQPEDYEAIAKEFEGEGREDLARAARQRATELRAEQETARAHQAAHEFARKRDEVIRTTVQAHPELLDPGTELFQATEALLRRKPILLHYPEGFADAAEAARAFLGAGRAGALEKEVGELRQKLADYEQKLQPAVGGPSTASRTVNFNDLPPAEQRHRLLAELRTGESSGQGLFQ